MQNHIMQNHIMQRIDQTTVTRLRDKIPVPGYERQHLQAGIVHLGLGAFHRAHQALYTHAVLNQYGGPWGIIACSLRSRAATEQLARQDGLYTLVERSHAEEHLQVVGSIIGCVYAPDQPAALVALMAQPQIKIVSLTVTEKGYCHYPATGRLNLDHEDIQHDIVNLDRPRSAIGFIVAALAARYKAGVASFTLLSCDNLPHNGQTLAQVVLEFAQHISADLAAWIQTHSRFPNTMVDRIVPAMTAADRAKICAQLGLEDQGSVIAEPFCQWVIEDNFCNGRPPWEKVGALLVADVRAYETLKLRLLNGAHSIMAYTGYLSGFDTISQVMAQPAMVNMIKQYMENEAGVSLEAPPGFNLADYQHQLLMRFANQALQHRTAQISMDGSQKLPQRLLASLRVQLLHKGECDIICLGIAAWIRYVAGVDERGELIEVIDPYAEQLRHLCQENLGNSQAMVQAIVKLPQIFATDLAEHELAALYISRWLEKFYSQGVLASIEEKFNLPPSEDS